MELLLCLILLLVPIIPPIFNLGYEGAKVAVFVALVSACILVWFLKSFQKPNHQDKVKIGILLKLSGLFFLILLVSSVIGINPQISLMGKNPYFQGVILYAYLWVFAFLTSTSIKKTKYCLLCIFASSILIALWAIKDWLNLNFFNGYVPTYAGRVVSSFGQPNFYAGYLLLTLSLVFPLTSEKKGKIFFWIGLIPVVLAIAVSASRAGIFIALALGLVFLAHKFWRFKKTALVIGTASFLGGVVLAVFIFEKEIASPSNLDWLRLNSPEKREYIWQVMGELILNKPVLGYGLENIDTAYAGFFASKDFNSLKDKPAYYSLKNLVVDRSHSYPLDILMYSGIVGFLVWVLLIYKMAKKTKGYTRIFLAVYIAWSLVQIHSVAHLMLFYFVLGLTDSDIG